MIVYVVAVADTYDDCDVSILGVFKDEKDAEKCFTDYILNEKVRDLTDEEKEGIKRWNYWSDSYRITIFKKEVK